MNFVKIHIYLPSRVEDLSSMRNVSRSEAVINISRINSVEKLFTPNGYSTVRMNDGKVYYITNGDADILITKLGPIADIDSTTAASSEPTIHLE